MRRTIAACGDAPAAFGAALGVVIGLSAVLPAGPAASGDAPALRGSVSAPAPARDRLVEACEVAVLAHAERVRLAFSEAERSGLSVTLDIQVDGTGGRHLGQARCTFRETPADEPPSLLGFEAMGRSGYGLFLVSHHAVWAHFTRHLQPPAEAVAPEPGDDIPAPSRPRKAPAIKAG